MNGDPQFHEVSALWAYYMIGLVVVNISQELHLYYSIIGPEHDLIFLVVGGGQWILRLFQRDYNYYV